MNAPAAIPECDSQSADLSTPDLELRQLLARARPGELWLAVDRAGRPWLVRLIYREEMADPAEFEVCRTRLNAWAALTRGLQRHLQVVHVGHRSDPDCLYCVIEAPDAVYGQQIYEPTSLESLLARHGALTYNVAREVGLVLAEAIEQLHRSGFVHGAVSAGNVFLVNGEARLGLPDLRLGLPGCYLGYRLHPESDVRTMVELVGDLTRQAPDPRPTRRHTLARRFVSHLLGRSSAPSPGVCSAAALRAALKIATGRAPLPARRTSGWSSGRSRILAFATAALLVAAGGFGSHWLSGKLGRHSEAGRHLDSIVAGVTSPMLTAATDRR